MGGNVKEASLTVTRSGTAFIAGATGYTGRALVHELARSGITTVAHVRPDSPRLAARRAEFASAGARTDTTPWDEDAMAATLARLAPDVIYALLGTTQARGGDYAGVDYGLSALLLRAARRAVPAARFVYLSSIGAGPKARGEYLQLRWRFEEELRASGQPWVIARPSFITGPDREESRPKERMGARITDAVVGVAAVLGVRGPRDRFGSMNAGALARGLARAGFEAGALHRVLGTADLR